METMNFDVGNYHILKGQDSDFNKKLAAVTDDNEDNETMKPTWTPTTDFYVAENSFIVNVKLPICIFKEDINVNIFNNNQHVISGKMKKDQLSGGSYKIKERHDGHFTRKITLTSSVSDNKMGFSSPMTRKSI
ncbi:hypothetical protein RhiirA4_455271 [Rhizophagus irregularis]|uniref:SHSP domain-containing protein n=1 Tax=Rhizophagus irregularis TaxID=588596 RepID=A0A2I1G4U9_9GLOM|nr:hypothetical protein RhiirA4_455271 [Rhizophagus irregularis]